MRYRGWYSPPTVGELRSRALEHVRRLRKAGQEVRPVEPISGHRIATTFWGKAWCDNLLRYSDFANRMPRGRKYVRSGSVVHLAVDAGLVRALVSGTDLYVIEIRIEPLPAARWAALRTACAGEVPSLVALLAGRPPERVMEIVSRPGEGLFPAPGEIALDCSCPDWAAMCKHVAAALYGIGARLDQAPEQLFRLRGVSADDLVGAAVEAASEAPEGEALASDDLSALFGVEIEMETPAPPAASRKKAVRKKAARKKAVRKKAVRKKVARKKAARKKAARKKAARKKAARKKAARKKAVRKTPVRKKAVRKKRSRATAGRGTAARRGTLPERQVVERAGRRPNQREIRNSEAHRVHPS